MRSNCTPGPDLESPTTPRDTYNFMVGYSVIFRPGDRIATSPPLADRFVVLSIEGGVMTVGRDYSRR